VLASVKRRAKAGQPSKRLVPSFRMKRRLKGRDISMEYTPAPAARALSR